MSRPRPPWLWPLLACAVLTQTALNLARPLGTYEVIGLGGGATEVGVVTAVYALLPLLAAVPLGRLTDRVPRLSRVLVAGTLLLGVAPLLLSLTGSVAALAAVSALLGLGHLVFMVAAQGAVARWSAEDALDRGFGWFTAAVSVGQLAGPLLAGAVLGSRTGPALADATDRGFFLAGAVALLALVPAGLLARRSPVVASRSTSSAPLGTVGLLRRPGVPGGLYVSLALLATVDVLTAYLPLLADAQRIAPAVVGVLLGVRSAATICSRVLLDRLVLRVSRERLVVISALGSAAALAVVPVPGLGAVGMGVALTVGGFLLGVGQPLTMTLLVRAVPHSARSSALALRLLANRLGQVTVPAAAALVSGAAGGAAGGIWLACGVLVTAAGVATRAPAEVREAARTPVPGQA